MWPVGHILGTFCSECTPLPLPSPLLPSPPCPSRGFGLRGCGSFYLDHLEKVGSHGALGDLCVSGLLPLALFPGCVLLYKQDFTKKLGLCCITCTYCSQTCQRGVTEQLDGSTWDFCSEDCKSKYLLWYCKVRGVVRQRGGQGQQEAGAVALTWGR